MMWCQAPERRLLRSAAVLAVVLAAGACEFPTEAPIFESHFVIPSETTTLQVNQLLPSSITVANGAFQLALTPATLNRTLGSMCAACIPFNGQTVPYPGFSASVGTTITIPSDVASATLASGAVNLSIQNAFGFDPLSPPGASTGGQMVVTVTNNGRTLGTTTVTGPFPTGTTKNATVALAPGNLSGPIDISVAITSPAGGLAPANFVTVNTNGSLNLVATPQAIAISSATVAVSNKNINVNSIDLNLADIDDQIASHASKGAIILKMDNPFSVTGALSLKVTGEGVNITKTVTIAPGTTTQRIEFSGAEIRSMLGHHLTLTINGPVNGSGGAVTVTPGQILNIDTSLDLTVQVGGTVN
jgi:hypothetical protein